MRREILWPWFSFQTARMERVCVMRCNQGGKSQDSEMPVMAINGYLLYPAMKFVLFLWNGNFEIDGFFNFLWLCGICIVSKWCHFGDNSWPYGTTSPLPGDLY